MTDTARLRKQGYRPYRKLTITYAKQMKKSFAVRLINGDKIYGQPGDYACVSQSGDDRWIVNHDVFEKTYAPAPVRAGQQEAGSDLIKHGFRPYSKHQITWAKKIDRPRIIHTIEGDVIAQAGDYLCVGANGEKWPQKPERFEAHYEPATTHRA